MEAQANVGLIGNMAVVPTTKIKYVLYSRKSTESEERQILSIDSQINEMLSLAEKEGLEIIDIRRESHSAKESGQRPVFKEILEDIRRSFFFFSKQRFHLPAHALMPCIWIYL